MRIARHAGSAPASSAAAMAMAKVLANIGISIDAKLPVPAGEYGAVRKLLEEKARAGVLRLDPAILGL